MDNGRNDDTAYLEQLICQGEHQQQDFKYRVSDARKLARSVSAFANTDGGRLLIGVRDDGHLSGVRSEEEVFMMHEAAWKYCTPPSDIHFDTYKAGKRMIVVATIPPAKEKPVFALDENDKKTAYIRVKDENIVASVVHIEIWKQQRRPSMMMRYSDKAKTIINTMETHPDETLNHLVRLSGIGRHHVIATLARLIRYGVAEWHLKEHEIRFSLT